MTTFHETWKGIAGSVCRSERWCRYMAQRPVDPLPVFKIGGIVRLDQCDLEDWLLRERERSTRRVPALIASEPMLRLIA